jgi:hypothetical protein
MLLCDVDERVIYNLLCWFMFIFMFIFVSGLVVTHHRVRASGGVDDNKSGKWSGYSK